MHQISLPDALYLSVPAAERPAGAKPWVRFDTKPMTADRNDVVRTLSQAPGSDDSVLAPGVSTVTAVAPVQLDGKNATRCDLRIDLPAMYRSEASRATNPRIRQLLLEQAGNSAGTAQAALWIDSAGLPAQLRLDVPAGAGPNQQSHPAVTETVSYRDWGAPINITAPPPDQVGTS